MKDSSSPTKRPHRSRRLADSEIFQLPAFFRFKSSRLAQSTCFTSTHHMQYCLDTRIRPTWTSHYSHVPLFVTVSLLFTVCSGANTNRCYKSVALVQNVYPEEFAKNFCNCITTKLQIPSFIPNWLL